MLVEAPLEHPPPALYVQALHIMLERGFGDASSSASHVQLSKRQVELAVEAAVNCSSHTRHAPLHLAAGHGRCADVQVSSLQFLKLSRLCVGLSLIRESVWGLTAGINGHVIQQDSGLKRLGSLIFNPAENNTCLTHKTCMPASAGWL